MLTFNESFLARISEKCPEKSVKVPYFLVRFMACAPTSDSPRRLKTDPLTIR
jgi:hypothetical protein